MSEPAKDAPFEFSRPLRLDSLGGEPRKIHIEADEAERAALARRFALPAIARLEADATVTREGTIVRAEGRLRAEATQSCVATGDPLPATIDEPFALRFEPEGAAPEHEEVELDEGDLDVITYTGGAIDLGEAVAQGFALALDPFPRSPRATEALRAAGVRTEEEAEREREQASPFAALKGLTKEN